MGSKEKAKLKRVKARIKTPFLDIEGDWEADQGEQMAAWEMYVELVTRVSVQKLNPAEGILREALSSLHDLFPETRKILKKYGPSIAKPKGEGHLSFGALAVTVLNSALRPVLSKWHPLLDNHERTNKGRLSAADHESVWEHNEELRRVLGKLEETLRLYAHLLAEVAGVPPLWSS